MHRRHAHIQIPVHGVVVRVRGRVDGVLDRASPVSLLSRVPDRVRDWLDDWKVWVSVSYIGLAALVVGLYFVNSRTSETLAKQAAAAAGVAAEKQAGIQADYRACLVSIPQLTQVNRFVRGVQDLHVALLQNATASHRATPPGSALYRQQIVNIARLRRNVTAVLGVSFPVPTRASCEKRRKQDTP